MEEDTLSLVKRELDQAVRLGADRAALLVRSVRACLEAVESLDRTAVGTALAQARDRDALVALLSASRLRGDPLLPARLRGVERMRQLLEAEGGAWSSVQVSEALGITRQGVDWRRKQGLLLGLRNPGRRGWVYPRWQFDDRGALEGLDRVLAALSGRDVRGWMAASFFLQPSDLLDGTRPLDALRAGRTDEVIRAAAAHGEHRPA